MSDTGVQQVRRFNRIVTERVGALDDHFLGLNRPLGQARLLWEIGPDGAEVRQLRSRLGLDSGYVSRLLRSLEAARLIAVGASGRDRRIRVARLTAAGRRERDALDRRSDERASALLEPLSPRQRERLLAAMGEVERVLRAGSVEIRPVDPEQPDALHCLAEYVAELNLRSERGFDPSVGATVSADEVRPPAGRFFVAYLHGDPIGCGAVKLHDDAPAEIKRMWLAPQARGLGLGRRFLETLEEFARAGGATVAQIETSAVLHEALALYRSAGWEEVARFNDEPFADHWLQKRLSASSEQPGDRAAGVPGEVKQRRGDDPEEQHRGG